MKLRDERKDFCDAESHYPQVHPGTHTHGLMKGVDDRGKESKCKEVCKEPKNNDLGHD